MHFFLCFFFSCLIKRLVLSFCCSMFQKKHVQTLLFLFFVKALGHSVSRKRSENAHHTFFFFFFLHRDSFAFCSLEPLCERSRSSARLAADTKDVFSDGYEKLGYFGGHRVIERRCRCRSKKVVVFFRRCCCCCFRCCCCCCCVVVRGRFDW